jgi:hypothetical protein
MPKIGGGSDFYVKPMLCEKCHEHEATVHLGGSVQIGDSKPEPDAKWEHHFCAECADDYFANTPGMNSSRDLICLSEWYRSKLYDLLETTHPEAFDNSDTEACRRGSELMRNFLRKHLTNNKIEMNEDAFEMLCKDFFCSHHFYSRVDEYKRKKS